MNTVNLLPWRQQWRRHRYVQFIQIILLVFFSVGLATWIVWLRWQNESRDWQAQILLLQQQVIMSHQQVESSKKQKKQIASLQHKISAEQQNNARILEPILLLISLAPAMNEKMHLISLKMESQDISLEAQVVSSEQLQQLMTILSATHCFTGLKLHAIRQNEQSVHTEHFTLSFRITEAGVDTCLELAIDKWGAANEPN